MQKLKSEIRQKIIDVGRLRFQKEGFEKTAMKDIASDAGISIGNIYRYFLTKKHILDEILSEIETEIENFFQSLPSSYKDINMHILFELVSDFTIKVANENHDTLKVMFNSQDEKQFISFKEKIISVFTKKMISIAKSMSSTKEISEVLCEAVARAEFEGFVYIVKKYIDDIAHMKENLEIYGTLMMENLGKNVLDVSKE